MTTNPVTTRCASNSTPPDHFVTRPSNRGVMTGLTGVDVCSYLARHLNCIGKAHTRSDERGVRTCAHGSQGGVLGDSVPGGGRGRSHVGHEACEGSLLVA